MLCAVNMLRKFGFVLAHAIPPSSVVGIPSFVFFKSPIDDLLSATTVAVNRFSALPPPMFPSYVLRKNYEKFIKNSAICKSKLTLIVHQLNISPPM